MADSPNARNQQILTVASMYVGYVCFMIMRTIPTVAGPAIVDDPSLDVDLDAWGKILTAGTCGGIAGKIVCGWMADRFGGKFTFTLGLLVTTVSVAVFATQSTAVFFGAAFFVALMAKSAGWPAMAKIIGHWFHRNQYGRVWGVISTSSRVGTILATFSLAALLASMSWRSMLAVAVAICAVAVVYCAFRLRERPPEGLLIDDPNDPEDDIDGPHPFDGTTLPEALVRFFVSPRFWLITCSLMGLTILWDFLFFVPFYLKETLKVSAAQASQASTAFPVGSLISVLVGGYVFDRLSRAQMAIVMGILLAVATGCLLAFYMMPTWNLEKQSAVYLSLGLLFVFGLCVSPCYYIPMSVFSIEYGGIHSGFLIALLDVFGFGASAVFSFFGGGLAERSWGLFFTVLLAIAVWSLLSTFFFLRGEAKAQRLASNDLIH